MITLTQEERDKFAQYLEESAASTLGLVDQMKKIAAPDALIKNYSAEMMAARIIAAKLRATETL